MNRARCALVLAAALPLSGCVGISIHTTTTSAQATSGVLCGLAYGQGGSPPDQAAVRRSCGKPVREEAYGDDIRWHYRESLAWRGVVIWAVVLPIPLVVPVGFNARTVAFDGPSLHWVESERAGKATFFGCGPFFGHIDYGCGTSTRE